MAVKSFYATFFPAKDAQRFRKDKTSSLELQSSNDREYGDREPIMGIDDSEYSFSSHEYFGQTHRDLSAPLPSNVFDDL